MLKIISIMKNTSELLLKIMRILAWFVFVALLIKAGAFLMSYGVSINNQEAANDLYRGTDLSRYERYSFVQYSLIVFYHIILYILQAYIALFVVNLIKNINLEQPFTIMVATILQKISITIFVVWILAMIHNVHVAILERYAGIEASFFSGEYIFLAGVIFVLAFIFKKGVRMQHENELTI